MQPFTSRRSTKRLTAIVGIGSALAITVGTAALTIPATSAHAATALPNNWYASAPYLMPEDNNPPDVAAVMDATGQKAFQLAFILAGSGCTATWNGSTPIDNDPAVDQVISTIRGKGGDVSVSQGGYGGTKLGQTCSSPQDEASALQQVIDHYDLHAIDFDVEEPEYENTTAVDNEVGAAQILQSNNSGLYVSITMPGTPAGTGYFGENVLKTAKSLDFTPNNFSIMPFDNGISGASAAESALTAFNGLLQTDLGWDASTAWSHQGISGMNGRTDSGEMYTTSDFQSILDFAESKGMARYTFWSVNRDRPCSGSEGNDRTWGDCSSTDAAAWSYTAFTKAFADNTPVQPPGGGTGPPPGDCAAAWSATTAYNGGDQVSYQGHDWTARWWTQGDVPGDNAQDVWVDAGACS